MGGKHVTTPLAPAHVRAVVLRAAVEAAGGAARPWSCAPACWRSRAGRGPRCPSPVHDRRLSAGVARSVSGARSRAAQHEARVYLDDVTLLYLATSHSGDSPFKFAYQRDQRQHHDDFGDQHRWLRVYLGNGERLNHDALGR